MIDDELTAAIAHLKVGGARGTAFLVSDDGLVLTAAHCVTFPDSTNEVPRWIDQGDACVGLEFGEKKARFQATAELPPVAFDVTADWALLRCKPQPPATPIVLSERNPELRSWETWGFPSTIQDAEGRPVPEPYAGTIDQDGATMVLSFRQYGDKTMAGGMSGAPVLVGREAVGIVLKSAEDAARYAVQPTLWAGRLPRDLLSQHGLVVHSASHPLQDVLLVLLSLNEQGAKYLADRLKLANFLTYEERGPAIARRLLLGPWPALRRCQDSLASVAKHGLVGPLLCAARIPLEALRAASESIESEDKGMTIYATQDLTAELHAFGACIPRYLMKLGQRVFAARIPKDWDGAPGEGLLSALCGVLQARFHEAPDCGQAALRAAIESAAGELKPFFVVVLDPVDDEDLDPIRAGFPTARFIVRSERDSALDEKLPLVAPRMTREREDEIALAYRGMPAELRISL